MAERPIALSTVYDALPPRLRSRLYELARQWRTSAQNAKRDPHGRAAYTVCAQELLELIGAKDE